MAWIPLGGKRGPLKGWALVDDADLEWLSQWRWCLMSNGYAGRATTIGGRDGVHRCFLMHRELLGLQYGDRRQTDHINRDKLDNRRANLRLATGAENSQNQAGGRGRSGIRGVYWIERLGKWSAEVILSGEKHWLGHFHDKEEAGRVAAEFRAAHMPFSEDAA